jgi:sn-glycerol 3-phosphate transport system permease protein
MLKRVLFKNPMLPYWLVGAQILVTVIFFYWPALRAVAQSVLLADPFGQHSRFVWFENFTQLFHSPEYLQSLITTLIFTIGTVLLSLATGLLFALAANRAMRGLGFVKTLLILPYAVAPALAGVLWLFLFHPSYGVLAFGLRRMGIAWQPLLNGDQALTLVIVAAAWKEISYNFVFYLAGLQSIPKSLIEASAVDGATRVRQFWAITFPLLTPTSFFLMVVNFVYAFFDTFGIIHAVTQGGPGGSTNTLIYKVFSDGFIGLNLGASSAESVVLMVVVVGLTVLQFRYVERRVQYEAT